MVEVRHGLILRRQTLRKQLEYNNGVADTAQVLNFISGEKIYCISLLA